jgi:hypothetical protein
VASRSWWQYVLVDLSDRQCGLLAVHQIWRELFLGVSLASIVSCGGAGGRGEVGALERGCWSGGGGSVVIPRLCWWDAVVLGPRKHGDVPRSTCHSDMCLAACSGPVHRLTKPRWWWCFLDLAKEVARRLFQRASWRHWTVAAAASFSACRKV